MKGVKVCLVILFVTVSFMLMSCSDNDQTTPEPTQTDESSTPHQSPILPLTENISDEYITFADPNLEGFASMCIHEPTGDPWRVHTSDLHQVTDIQCSNQGVSDLTGLEYCVDLIELYLNGNKIVDISETAELSNLIYLSLDFNQIEDISSLSNLTNIQELSLAFNNFSDISGLSNLTNISSLHLEANQISDISPLSNLSNLSELTIYFNQIEDISPLITCTELSKLWLDDNQISDISPLVENNGIGAGDEIVLTGNPLNEASVNVYIPQLEERGVEVTWE